MVHVVEELVVETFNVLERRDDLLKVLILGTTKDGIVDLIRVMMMMMIEVGV